MRLLGSDRDGLRVQRCQQVRRRAAQPATARSLLQLRCWQSSHLGANGIVAACIELLGGQPDLTPDDADAT